MLANTSLPHSPLYDPKSKIRNLRYAEDFENLKINLLGTRALYSDPSFYYYLGKYKEWKRPREICRNPYFINGQPDRFDAQQGRLGDCWLMGAMALLPLHPDLFKHVVPAGQGFGAEYIGAFHFRIWQLGTWYDVVVDDRLPVWKEKQKLCYGHSVNGDVFWAALLEKAYAKIYAETYDSLNTGFYFTSLQDLSGGIVERVQTHSFPPGTTLKWFINEVFSMKALMGCVCYDVVLFKDDLVPKHGYTITNVFQCADDHPTYPGLYLIRIMDVAHHPEWKGDWADRYIRWREIDREIRNKMGFVVRDDGEFWMNEVDFANYFGEIFIAYLGPGQYEKSRRTNIVETWESITFHGEWKKNVNAGGMDKKSRHINPQYRIELRWPDNDSNRDMRSNVVIELTHRAKNDKKFASYVGFFIYSLKNVKNPPMPLNSDFFFKNDALNETIDISRSSGRAYLDRMQLEPGKYCIVPFTYEANKPSQFLLRVFAESRVEMWEYDTQISRSAPKDKGDLVALDAELNKLFHEVADDGSEIDWIAMKNVLEKTMKKDKSSIAIITKIKKLFLGGLETFLPISFSDEYNAEKEALFSKDDCRSMIAMLDADGSGKLSYSEFSDLWDKICFWTEVYKRHSDIDSEQMRVSQLRDALASMGFNINKQLIGILIHRYGDNQEIISLKDFIICGVGLESAISSYEECGVHGENKITLTLEEWVKKVLFF